MPSPSHTVPAAEAIPELLHEYGDRIYRLGVRICHEPDVAEDLVQETFLRAYRSWDRFEGRSEPLTWLFSIAARACQRMERRRAGQPRRMDSLDTLMARATAPPELASHDESPLEGAARGETRRRLREAISTLPAAFRLPLVLKEIEELSVREVADILGLAEGTVKSRLHRARLAVAAALRPAGALDADEAAHTRRECSDLLVAKLEAMARGVPFPVADERICARCSSAILGLDALQGACRHLPAHPLPEDLRASVLRTMEELEGRD